MKLTSDEIKSVKKSYIQILVLFLKNEMIESKFVYCLLKWGVQLNLSLEDIKSYEKTAEKQEFDTSADKARALFNLVFMIYLDDIVEDVELEIAILYARELGIDSALVGDFFKAIATAPFDGKSTDDVREEIQDYLRLYGISDQ